MITAGRRAQGVGRPRLLKKIDVLVSDINMPEVDGYELIRRVRAMKLNKAGGFRRSR